MSKLACFKTYDVRGRVGESLDVDISYNIGRAVAQKLTARRIVVGRDIRDTSPALFEALSDGMRDAGADVLDIGLCGTEEVYFATDFYEACAGVMVTASHNPIDYNGFKMVGKGARPLPESVFFGIESVAATRAFETPPVQRGARTLHNPREAYVERICKFTNPATLGPIHLVANAGNGCAGPTFDAVLDVLQSRGAQIQVTRLHHTPDHTFPNGIPNPLLPSNQPVTSRAIQAVKADLGIAWDGDFDRCFFFDESGDFIQGEFVVALLAQTLLERHGTANIVYDPRVVWNTRRIIQAAGGTPIMSKTGHVLVKDKMRTTNAVYGGEMSAHHYFRDFMYCDSGMIPWLLMLERLSCGDTSLSTAVAEMRRLHPSSGEVNFHVSNSTKVMDDLKRQYEDKALAIDTLDGVSIEFKDWRFNLRASNTEPLLRLNVEVLGSWEFLGQCLANVTRAIESVA